MKFSMASFMILLMGFSFMQDDQHLDADNDYKSLSKVKNEWNIKSEMTDEYEKEWKEIDSLIAKLLPQSAFDKVEELTDKIASTDNHAQIIKCIIYRNRLLIELEDKDPSQAIVRLHENIASEKNTVAKSVMQSMLAELYFLYAQRNQYKIQGRTYTIEEPTDLATWSLASLIKKSNALYLESIAILHTDTRVLDEYRSILIPAKDKLQFKSDINSFLLHRVVSHFSNSQSLLVEPVYAYVMDDLALLDDLDDFLALKFMSKDSSSYKLKALKTYQKLLNYLKEKERTEELVYTDLQRIVFVHTYLNADHKDESFFKRLDAMSDAYKEQRVSSEINYRKARYLKVQGDKYRKNFDNQYKGKIKMALEIAQKAKERFPNSFGAQNCSSLIEEIQRKELSVQIEQVISAEQPYLIYSGFRNIEAVTFRIYSITNTQLFEFRRTRQKEKIEYLSKLNIVGEATKSLIPIDYDYHAVEHIMEGLAFGQYLLVASDEVEFNNAELLSFGNFRVSNLAYAAQDREDNLEVLVFDRNTGSPIHNAKVELHEDNWREKVDLSHLDTKYTTKEGKVIFKKDKEIVSLKIKFKGDSFESDQRHYGYHNSGDSSYENCHLFTDRNIYRPGQKLYFKGL